MRLKKGEKKQRLLALADFIEKQDPKHFNMGKWAAKRSYGWADFYSLVCPADVNVCGTTCCIAGWHIINKGLCLNFGGAVYDGPGGTFVGEVDKITAEDLNLTPRQKENLFHLGSWPRIFSEMTDGSTGTPEVAAKRIRYMVNTGR